MPSCSPPSSPSSHSNRVIHALQFRGRGAGNKRNDPLRPYFNAAQRIPLTVNPFATLNTITYAGLPDQGEESTEQFSAEDILMHEDVMRMVPTFKAMVLKLFEDPAQLEAFIAYLGSATAAARQEDTASLKHDILTYIPEDPTECILPALTKHDPKSLRGFNHIATASCLCPMDKYAMFSKDQNTFMEKVNDGTHHIKASGWPTFLYNLLAPYDRRNKDRGLFRGLILARVLRHIFTGPSSAFGNQRKGTKPSKAELHQITAVTGRMIAYAAVQARFALSSVESWRSQDGEFDYEVFFNNIVDLFETDPGDPWVVDTLKW